MTVVRKYLVVVCLALLAIASWVPAVSEEADQVAQQGLQRTLKTYAVGRAVSSTVSVLASANVGFLKVGEALHPILKLTDQFLDVMLLASASFAMQIFLLKIGAYWAVSLALTATLTYIGVKVCLGRYAELGLVKSCAVLLLLVRFSVPVIIFASQAIYSFALEERENAAVAKVGSMQSASAAPGSDVADDDKSKFERMKERLNISTKIERMVAFAREFTHHMAQLIAGYILQSVVLPLVFLWMLWLVARAAMSGAFLEGSAGQRSASV